MPKLIQHLRDNWGKYVAAGIVGAILTYLYLRHKDGNPNSTVKPPVDADGSSPDAAAKYCSECYNKDAAPELDAKRKIR